MPKISGKLFPIYIFIFVQGFYAMIFQSVLFRELLARFAGTEFILVVLFGSFLFWTAVGCVGGSFIAGKLNIRPESFASRMLAISAFTGVCSYLLPWGIMVFRRNSGSLELMVLLAFAAPVLFGIVNGFIYGVFSSFLHDGELPGTYSMGAAGAMFGGVIFSGLFADYAYPLRLLCYSSLPVLAAAFFASLICAFKKMYIQSVFSTLVVSALVSLYVYFLGTEPTNIIELKGNATWSVERSFETQVGRVDLVRLPSQSKALFLNGVKETDYPPNSNILVPDAVFAMMQVNKPAQKVLLCCSPFSGLPKAFMMIPALSELTLVCEDRHVAMAARSSLILPPKRDNFRVFVSDPVSFLDKALAEEYDLVYIEPPPATSFAGNRFYTREFFDSVSKALKPDGVMAFSFGDTASPSWSFTAPVFADTLAFVFADCAVVTGKGRLVVAGNRNNISSNLDVLDARISRNLRNFYRFPDGLLSIVFSQKKMDSELEKLNSYRKQGINSIQKPLLPFEYLKAEFFPEAFCRKEGLLFNILHLLSAGWLVIVGVIISAYSFARFILSRRMGMRLLFCSFENGFYSIGIVAVMLFVYQCCCGSLYSDLPALFGVFIGGVALGSISYRRISELLRNVLMFCSIMAPVASYAFFGMLPSSAAVLIFGTLFICGISGGIAFSELCVRSAASRGTFFWGLETAGGAAVLSFLMLYLLPSAGFLPCLAMLTLVRVPFLAGGKHGSV